MGHNASGGGAGGGEVGGSKYKFYDVDGREKNGAQTPGGNQTVSLVIIHPLVNELTNFLITSSISA